MMNNVIITYVDQALEYVQGYSGYLMYEDDPVPESMSVPFDQVAIDNHPRCLMMEHRESDGLLLELAAPGKYFWQAVEGLVSDADISEVEQRYGIHLPDSYREYLRYRHFYTIFFQPDIKLYPKPVGGWKQILLDHNDEMREELLEQGYFAIGDYSDHGVICLALNNGATEPRVVMVDYEYGAPENEEDEEVLGDGFIDFLERVVQQGTATVRPLKDWERRIYEK